MATADTSQSTEASTGNIEVTADNVQDHVEIQTQPAEAVASHLESWEGVASFIEAESDWSEIEGVGPKSAEALEGQEAALLKEANEHQISAGSDGLDEDEGDDESGDEKVDGDSQTDQGTTEEQDEDEDQNQEDSQSSRIKEMNPPLEFQAKIDHSHLADVVEAVKRVVDEARVQIHEDKISIRAVDPANVGLIDIKRMSKDVFESWNANPGVIGLNVVALDEILGMGSSGDIVELDFDAETRKLEINIDGLEYSLATIDPVSIRSEPEIPDLGLPAEATIDTEAFERGVKGTDMVADHAVLKMDSDGQLQFHAEGDTDDVDYDVPDEYVVSTVPAEAHSIFSLDYLKDFRKIVNNADECTLSLGNEFPLFLELKFESGVTILLMLAPRVEA